MLRVASYNVHACVGSDGVYDPERVLAVLHRIDAHVFALQETIDADWRGDSLVAHFARQLGAIPFFAPTLSIGGRRFGNLTLVRGRPATGRQVALPHVVGEPRSAVAVEFAAEGRGWQVVNTHFGLVGAERSRQARAVLALCREADGLAQVLAGDLNEWRPGARLGGLTRYFAPPPRRCRTFPSRWPLLPLDRVLVRAPARVATLGVERSRLARLASDHLPVVADLEPPAGASPAGPSRAGR